jgi:hypothetical protein
VARDEEKETIPSARAHYNLMRRKAEEKGKSGAGSFFRMNRK